MNALLWILKVTSFDLKNYKLCSTKFTCYSAGSWRVWGLSPFSVGKVLWHQFQVFDNTILTPENIIRPILYKNVMYTEYFSKVYPPFCWWLYVCWHRTLLATSRQVCISPVHSTSCSPLFTSIRMVLPRIFVQGNIFWRKNVKKYFI